jgi:geranylgeranyl pyrophosphate synthase
VELAKSLAALGSAALSPEWQARLNQQVYCWVEDAIERYAQSADQRTALMRLIVNVQPRTERRPTVASLQTLPLLIYGGLRGDIEPAVPVAGALTLLGLGLDLLDDLIDRDRAMAEWGGLSDAELQLFAVGLISTLPQIILSDLDAPAATIVALHRTLARGLLRGGVGQHYDLVLLGRSDISTAEVRDCAIAKITPLAALQTALPALLADAPTVVVERCAALGESMGMARSIVSEYDDLFIAQHSRDLGIGAYTWPIAHFLNSLDGQERDAFIALLRDARADAAAQREVRQCLMAAGIVRWMLFDALVYCQRARSLVSDLGLREPAHSALNAYIDGIVPLPGAGGM